MCFSVPVKIVSVNGNSALLETGQTVRLGNELRARPGDYARLTGLLVTEVLSKAQGEKILTLIADLNKNP